MSKRQFLCSECGQLLPLREQFENRAVCLTCADFCRFIKSVNHRRALREQQQFEKNRAKWLPHININADDWRTVPEGELTLQQDNKSFTVQIKSFQILQTPVTFAMFDVFCTARRKLSPGDNAWGRENRPVINVSFWDATEYAQWLSLITGIKHRLPSSTEWEYACRAGTTTAYSTGKIITTDQANFMVSDASGAECKNKTLPVASYDPNAWGIYDMHGNTWEWCASVFSHEFDPEEIHNPHEKQPGDRRNRCIRGGSWRDYAKDLLADNRKPLSPDSNRNDLGFRLVREIHV